VGQNLQSVAETQEFCLQPPASLNPLEKRRLLIVKTAVDHHGSVAQNGHGKTEHQHFSPKHSQLSI
jgi:hypothetical protein